MRATSPIDASAPAGLNLAPVGHCIYCAATEYNPANPGLTMSDEHIVARGLGGRLTLPGASCLDCQNRTSAVETKIVEALVSPSRKDLKIFGAKAKRRAKAGKETRPTAMPVFRLHPPGLMVGLPPTYPFAAREVGVIILSDDYLERVSAAGPRTIAFKHGFRADDFARLLAKTAHSYAIAALGGDGFQPLLNNAVRGVEPMNLSDLIGETVIPPQSASTQRHLLACAWEQSPEGRELLLVYVRLFGNRNSPMYCVVTGTRPNHVSP